RRHHRWPVDVIHEHGFALVTLHAADIDRDEHDFTDGVHGLLSVGHTFGTLAAWAWGLSRVLDWMLTRPDVFEPQRIIVAGHSRMGKAALLAAARDPRFAGVFANGSGCFGAALHVGKTGEQPSDIARFTHWFCPAFYEWVARGDWPKFDQDALLETIVPRPIAVGSAADDAWADPDAERRCVELLLSRHPSAPLFHHCRPGGHDINADDWRPALDFLSNALSRPR
ncbi:MAG: alpha/beta hydrolase, partial [Planctomycetota bacterium]